MSVSMRRRMNLSASSLSKRWHWASPLSRKVPAAPPRLSPRKSTACSRLTRTTTHSRPAIGRYLENPEWAAQIGARRGAALEFSAERYAHNLIAAFRGFLEKTAASAKEEAR